MQKQTPRTGLAQIPLLREEWSKC